MIATDTLSLVFIACFLIGLLYFVFTAILGNLGHGMTHHVTQSGAAHTTATHTISNGTAHTTGNVTSSHSTTHTHGSAQAQHQSPFAFINPTSIMLFLLGFGFFGYFFHNTIHAVAAVTLILAGVAGVVIAALLLILLSRLFGGREESSIQ